MEKTEMKYLHMRRTTSESAQGQLFRTVVFALAVGFGGVAYLHVAPVHAEQAGSQPASPGSTIPQDQGEVLKRLDRVEKELEQRKVERDKVRQERAKRLEEQKKKEQEWDTKFDLLRRDPQSRLEATKDGWLGFEGFESQVRFGGFLQTNLIHNFQDTDNTFGKFQPGKFPVPSGKTTSTEFDPRATRLVLETRTPTPMGNWSTFISIDFFGNNDPGTIEPRLRQAYLTGVGVHTGTCHPGRAGLFDLSGFASLS